MTFDDQMPGDPPPFEKVLGKFSASFLVNARFIGRDHAVGFYEYDACAVGESNV